MTTSYNTILGTETADDLVGTSGADSISALQGNDTINGKGGADLLFGGSENDTLTTSAAATGATFSGNKGNDTLSIGSLSSNSTSFFGGLGNDSLQMGAATVTGAYFSGDAGGDTITAAILNGSTVYGGNSTGTFADSNTDGNDSIAISSALNKSLLQGNGGVILSASRLLLTPLLSEVVLVTT